jgi:tripartite-type tricarboxylate transporter receptor subunit TctC
MTRVDSVTSDHLPGASSSAPVLRSGRRRVLQSLVASGALAIGALSGQGSARAQNAATGPWPQKPVRIVSPYPAGGSNDNVARLLAARLSDIWNQRVFVENKPGANNRIATEQIARTAPDGYNLLFAAAPHGANPGLYDNKLPYDTLRDFTPIARAVIGPVGFWVPVNSPLKSMRDLADAAKARPDMLFAGSPGNGSGPHLVIELFNYRTGGKLQHLPMKGDAPLAIEVVAGRVDVAVTGMTVMKPHYDAGKLRLLAVSSDKRFPLAPDAPTLAEAGFPTVDGSAWFGMVGPAGMAPEVVAKINRDINAILALPEVRGPLEAVGIIVATGTPEQFRAFIAADVEKWTQVAKATGMKPD